MEKQNKPKQKAKEKAKEKEFYPQIPFAGLPLNFQLQNRQTLPFMNVQLPPMNQNFFAPNQMRNTTPIFQHNLPFQPFNSQQIQPNNMFYSKAKPTNLNTQQKKTIEPSEESKKIAAYSNFIESLSSSLFSKETAPIYQGLSKEAPNIGNIYEEMMDNREYDSLIREEKLTTPSVIKVKKSVKRERDVQEKEMNEKAFELSFEDPKTDEFGKVVKMNRYTYEDFENVFKEIMEETYTFSAKYTLENFKNQFEAENQNLLNSFTQLSKEKKKEHVTEVKKLWKKVIYGLISYSKKIKEIQSSKIKYAKKYSLLCQKEVQMKSKKSQKAESQLRAKKLNKDVRNILITNGQKMLLFWRKSEKENVEKKKLFEKQEQERRKKEQEEIEIKRQERKLNFLLTQTELYSHFMAKKKVEEDNTVEVIDDTNDGLSRKDAFEKAKLAVNEQMGKTKEFDDSVDQIKKTKNDTNKTQIINQEFPQPKCFGGHLKKYQLEGLNWLIKLYDQGINGILADEMGLGKTIQTISFLAHLAEEKNIWGPYLIISPSSTLHNWIHEIEKFAPILKVIPYWGNPSDRKTLRKFWNPKDLYAKDSPFHVVVTSYGLILEDEKMFQKVKWQYMILDEAHAIKSSKSARWNTLLNFNCRNRMLLSGTPIQNNMQELWSLLHFIMPSLFDSHEEFNDWFSKDIEGFAKNTMSTQPTSLNEQQVKRLHMILKPFMLRRVKKDVESELVQKVEKIVSVPLSLKQKKMYQSIKGTFKNITSKTSSDTVLANYVMQLRKVCNHPDLFEEEQVESPYSFQTNLVEYHHNDKEVSHSIKLKHYQIFTILHNPITLTIPKLCLDSLQNDKNVIDIFNIFSSGYINTSLKEETSTFSFLKFIPFIDSIGEVIFQIYSNIIEAYLMLIHSTQLIHGKAFNILSTNNITFMNPMERYYENESLIKSVLINSIDKVTSPPIELYVPGYKYHYDKQKRLMNDEWTKYIMTGFSVQVPKPFLTVSPTFGTIIPYTADRNLLEEKDGGLISPFNRSNISFPRFSKTISDSSKLKKLDELLQELKQQNHRVLIFSQMTKMLNILQDLMIFKKYSYFRLDGSTSISDRNEMVTNFQTRDDIFVFLLSTRAGGLGITLTAADTVIFYDNDWNPTSDQQAMDRCHRIGQTKPVTVYRLISQGTIEERILNIANQKNVIQETVYNGSLEPVMNSKDVMALLVEETKEEGIHPRIKIETKKKKESLIDSLIAEVNEEKKRKYDGKSDHVESKKGKYSAK